jgi:hypothetical protein
MDGDQDEFRFACFNPATADVVSEVLRDSEDFYSDIFQRMTWDSDSAELKWLDSYLDRRNDVLAKKGWLLWRVIDRYYSEIDYRSEHMVAINEQLDVMFDKADPNPLRMYCDAIADIIGETVSVEDALNLRLLYPCEEMADDVCDFDTEEYDMDAVSYEQRMSRRDLCAYRMVLRLARVCRERGWKMVVPE